MTKKEARAAAKTAFESWEAACPSGPEAASRSIWEQLESSEEFLSAHSMLVYMSIRGEVITREFIAKWYGSKRIVLPLVKGEKLALKLYEPEHLAEGYRGIIEPTEDARDVDASDIDLAIIPGAAFTRSDDGKVLRLGRGGGFYDRLLPSLHCPLFGVCYSCRVMEDIPTDPWDIPLDRLYTESEI